MATIIEVASAATSTAGTSVTVTLANAPSAGETLIAFVGHSDDYPATPAGWTKVEESAITGVTTCFTKAATGSEGTSLTFTTAASGSMAAQVLRVSGLSSVDASAGNSSQGTNNVILPTLGYAAGTRVFAAAEVHATTPPASDFTWSGSLVAVGANAKSTAGAKRSMLGVASFEPAGAGSMSGATASYTPAATPTNGQGVSVSFLLGTTPLAVNAGSDQTIDAAGAAAISATATGGTGSKTYAWTIVSGGTGTFGSSTAATTTFTPSAAGTYVLRCTVTDDSGSASDDVTITATARRYLASIASSTGWTATGGTVQAVLADTSSATYVTSPGNPTGALIDGTLQPMTPPAAEQPLVVRLRGNKTGASTGSIVVKLYDGTTLRATQTVASVPNSEADMVVTFPAASITAITSWATGVRMTIEATAA